MHCKFTVVLQCTHCKNVCELYFGGLNGDKLYYGKPVIYDETRTHFMYPNEARLRNMTYGFSIHVDILVEYSIQQEGETIESTKHDTLGKHRVSFNEVFEKSLDLIS